MFPSSRPGATSALIWTNCPPVERNAVKHEARTVHHRDESSSTRFKIAEVEHTTENYNQWLTRQLKEDPAFVRSILGKTRFELFKAGKSHWKKWWWATGSSACPKS